MITKTAFLLFLGFVLILACYEVKAQNPLALPFYQKLNDELQYCKIQHDELIKNCKAQESKLEEYSQQNKVLISEKEALNSELILKNEKIKELENSKEQLEVLNTQFQSEKTEFNALKIKLLEEQFTVKILFALLLISWAGAGVLGWRQSQKNTAKKHSTRPKRIESPVKRPFNGALRPDVPDSIGIIFQEKILDAVEHNQAWHSSWEPAVKQGLQQLKNSDNPNRENIIAAFLMDFWTPLLACYETNTQQWQWFSTKFKSVYPEDWQVIIQAPSLKNKALSEVLNETDKVVGQGQQVKQLIRPVIILKNAQNNVLVNRKAWVEME